MMLSAFLHCGVYISGLIDLSLAVQGGPQCKEVPEIEVFQECAGDSFFLV